MTISFFQQQKRSFTHLTVIISFSSHGYSSSPVCVHGIPGVRYHVTVIGLSCRVHCCIYFVDMAGCGQLNKPPSLGSRHMRCRSQGVHAQPSVYLGLTRSSIHHRCTSNDRTHAYMLVHHMIRTWWPVSSTLSQRCSIVEPNILVVVIIEKKFLVGR